MPKVALLDMQGTEVGEIELSESVFGVEINKDVLHRVVVNIHANKRQGTQSTKTRAEVRGGGRKPWRQKGTGRARQGSIRAPQWIKGGIALGPKPRDYRYVLNKKMRRLAMKSALSSKVLDKNIIVLDNLNLEQIKTKDMVKVLNNLKATKALIVLPQKNDNVYKSTRNIQGMETTLVNTLNVYDILKYEQLILTKDTVAKIEEVYA